MNQKKYKIIGIAVLLIVLLVTSATIVFGENGILARKRGEAGSVYEGIELSEQTETESIEALIDEYLAYLTNKDGLRDMYAENNHTISRVPGDDPDPSWQTYLSLTASTEEKIDHLRNGEENRGRYHARTAANQEAFIKELFGEDAFQEVSYTLEPEVATDTIDAYFDVATGNCISQEEYLARQKAFWDEIAATENLEYEDLFQSSDPAKFREDIRSDIVAAHYDECPVKYGAWSSNTAYRVHFSFNGKDKAGDYENFRIVIEGNDTNWYCVSGMYWDYTGEPMYVWIDEDGNTVFVTLEELLELGGTPNL